MKCVAGGPSSEGDTSSKDTLERDTHTGEKWVRIHRNPQGALGRIYSRNVACDHNQMNREGFQEHACCEYKASAWLSDTKSWWVTSLGTDGYPPSLECSRSPLRRFLRLPGPEQRCSLIAAEHVITYSHRSGNCLFCDRHSLSFRLSTNRLTTSSGPPRYDVSTPRATVLGRYFLQYKLIRVTVSSKAKAKLNRADSQESSWVSTSQ